MKLRKIISAAAALLTAAALSAAASAEDNGFRTERELVLAAKTPYDGKYTNILWNTEETEGAGVPVVYGENVLFPVGNKIFSISESSGERTELAELGENVSENCRGALSGSKFLQPTGGGLALIDADSGELLSFRALGGRVCTDAAAKDGLGYVGVSSESGFSFLCVDISDGLETVWEYSSAEAPSSPSLYGEYVLFGAGDMLVVCHYRSGAAEEIPVGAEICGAPFAGEYAVYLSCGDGFVRKLRLNGDGSMEEDTLTSCQVGEGLSSPLAWNGRLYVCSEEGFRIIDSLNMEIISTVTDIRRGTDPVLCYGNGPRVYVVAPSEDYWKLYCILDAQEKEPTVTIPAGLFNFEGGRIAVSAGGTIYFRDGIGRLYAAQTAPYNILVIVLKLVLALGLIVMAFICIRYWAKNRSANAPPRY